MTVPPMSNITSGSPVKAVGKALEIGSLLAGAEAAGTDRERATAMKVNCPVAGGRWILSREWNQR